MDFAYLDSACRHVNSVLREHPYPGIHGIEIYPMHDGNFGILVYKKYGENRTYTVPIPDDIARDTISRLQEFVYAFCRSYVEKQDK
jgi:hypothetical protein